VSQLNDPKESTQIGLSSNGVWVINLWHSELRLQGTLQVFFLAQHSSQVKKLFSTHEIVGQKWKNIVRSYTGRSRAQIGTQGSSIPPNSCSFAIYLTSFEV